jgi:hypothetical protein
VCSQLKTTYFENKPWIECYKEVAKQFTAIKAEMRKIHPTLTNIEIIAKIIEFADSERIMKGMK